MHPTPRHPATPDAPPSRSTPPRPLRTRASSAWRSLSGLLTSALLAATAAQAQLAQVQTFPDPPRLQPPIHITEVDGGAYKLLDPYLAPMTTTRDGRVGLMRKRFYQAGTDARFHLYKPEQLAAPFWETAPGSEILSPAFEISSSLFDNLPAGTGYLFERATHFGICDPIDANPTVCNNDNDCYTFHVITAIRDGVNHRAQLWSTEVTVEVDQPKTAGAAIVDITTQTPIAGPLLETNNLRSAPEFHTPMIVGDNRLLVVRIGSGSLIEWTPDGWSAPLSGRFDTVYAYNDNPSSSECDVQEWTDFKPIAYAPVDPDLVADAATGAKRFGFIDHPFRSADGTALPTAPADIKDLGGRYIWMDFDAKNLFFGTSGRKLIDETTGCACDQDPACTPPTGAGCEHLYTVTCLPGATCDPYDPDAETQAASYLTPIHPHQTPDKPIREQVPGGANWAFLGRWSRGKMVLLDAAFNNTDFALDDNVEHHRMVDLYDGLSYRVGVGRSSTILGTDPSNPLGWPATTVQFGSPEHLLNAVPGMRPRTPRDVVWLATAGGRTDEIAFDDYLDRGMLIFSPMNAVFDISDDMNQGL
ncbi:MAG: hypothetical protein AAFX50_03335, partial [Acidobacteriota bacterium]